MTRPIDDQIILVTGATDGIGKGTARELAVLAPAFCCTVGMLGTSQRPGTT